MKKMIEGDINGAEVEKIGNKGLPISQDSFDQNSDKTTIGALLVTFVEQIHFSIFNGSSSPIDLLH